MIQTLKYTLYKTEIIYEIRYQKQVIHHHRLKWRNGHYRKFQICHLHRRLKVNLLQILATAAER